MDDQYVNQFTTVVCAADDYHNGIKGLTVGTSWEFETRTPHQWNHWQAYYKFFFSKIQTERKLI